VVGDSATEQAMGHYLWSMTHWPIRKLPISVTTTKLTLVIIFLLHWLPIQYLKHQMMQKSNVDSSAKQFVVMSILLIQSYISALSWRACHKLSLQYSAIWVRLPSPVQREIHSHRRIHRRVGAGGVRTPRNLPRGVRGGVRDSVSLLTTLRLLW